MSHEAKRAYHREIVVSKAIKLVESWDVRPLWLSKEDYDLQKAVKAMLADIPCAERGCECQSVEGELL